MKFHRDQEVKVKTHSGTSLGYILEDLDLRGQIYWWVQYQENGDAKVNPFPEKDLSEWNQIQVCTCGAHSVGSDRHSYHCEIKELS